MPKSIAGELKEILDPEFKPRYQGPSKKFLK
jgi:hypothetical protein